MSVSLTIYADDIVVLYDVVLDKNRIKPFIIVTFVSTVVAPRVLHPPLLISYLLHLREDERGGGERRAGLWMSTEASTVCVATLSVTAVRIIACVISESP